MNEERSVLDRAWEVYAAADVPRGNRWVLPDLSGWRWRVSPDVRIELLLAPAEFHPYQRPVEPGAEERLFSIRLDVDATLPENSMMLAKEAIG